MLLTRFVRGQLIVFIAISLVGTAVLATMFLRLPAAVGVDVRTVHAVFTDAARLYERAAVTYRGDQIGIVTAVRLVEGGVKADLRIDDDIDVPRDAMANIHSMSAVGEQYVDLVADTGNGPHLGDGATIPIGQTTVPPQIGPILDQTNKLLAALPLDDLNKVIDESYAALHGSASDLRMLLDNSIRLVHTADANYEATSQLIGDLQPVLGAVRASTPEIQDLTANLAQVTDQLRASDQDIRGLLHDGQVAAGQVGGLLDDVAPALPTLLRNLVSVGDVLRTYNDSLETIAVVYPALVAGTQSATAPNDAENSINLGLAIQQNDPPPCSAGFLPAAKWRAPSDTSTAPGPNGYCKLPHDSASAVRGARNLPCQAVPGRRAATPAECGAGGYVPEASGNPPFPSDSPVGSLLPLHAPSTRGGNASPTMPGKELPWQSLLLTLLKA